MKQPILFFALSLLFVLPLSAQKHEKRRVPSFDQITVTGGIEVIAKPAQTESIYMEVDGISPSKVITEVVAQELKIRLKPGVYHNIRAVIYVGYVHLREVHARVGAEVELQGKINSDYFVAQAGSGATLQFEINGGKVVQRTKEGGKIFARGNVLIQDSRSFTGGKIFAKNMQSLQAYVKVHTGGEAHIFVTDQLEAQVGSVGKLNYLGNPNFRSIESNLGGSVNDTDIAAPSLR